jgi:hypothetical protein
MSVFKEAVTNTEWLCATYQNFYVENSNRRNLIFEDF